MCEPLRGKRVQCPEYLDMDGFDYEAVKSAVEFYKKYRYDAMKFIREMPALFDEYKKWLDVKFDLDKYDVTKEDEFELYVRKIHSMSDNIFQDWLFDYCFGDVIE